MSDDKNKSIKETLASEVQGLAKEVYTDVGKPVLAPVGEVTGGLAKLVLWPVKLALDTANASLAKLAARVEQKLKAVPPERQIAAPATIAGPCALQYALLGDGADVAGLRDMFECLLARSMDRETAARVHPAFVGIVAQMTPDEARILKSIHQSEYAAAHVQDFTDSDGNGIPRGLRTMLGRGIGVDESRLPEFISNLDRLGILRIEYGTSTTLDYFSYEKIEAMVNAEFPTPDPSRNLSLNAGAIFVTALGAEFLATCVDVHVRAARYG